MRRHAEGLIILSGSTPGRGWRDPVPVVDVLRAAVAEVEDYVRVDVVSESRDLVAGNAVNDVIHLVAELVENATVFSPPNTRIEVRADRVGVGLVAEIEDRGLGLSRGRARRDQRAAGQPARVRPGQQRAARPVRGQPGWPPGTPSRCRCASPPYGGTTAILLLPFGVIVRAEDAELRPAGPGCEPTASARARRRCRRPSRTGATATGPLPTVGASVRHRLPRRPTGRRAETVPDTEASRPPYAACPGRRGSTRSRGSRPLERRRRPSNGRNGIAETAPPWFDAFSRRPANERRARGARGRDPGRARTAGRESASPAPAEPQRAARQASPALPSSHLGMPVRVPQASLAPQLPAAVRRWRVAQAAREASRRRQRRA